MSILRSVLVSTETTLASLSSQVDSLPSNVEAFRLPPGPKTQRLFNGLVFLAAQQRSIRRLKRRWGDAYTVDMPVIGKTVVVSRPDLVKAVFTADPRVLHGGKNPLGVLLGPGSLFSMDEERHLRERRTLLPPFHGDRMRSYEELIEEETLRAMQAWPDGQEFPTIATFQRVTLRVILRAVFGAEGSALTSLERLLAPMTSLGQRLVTIPILQRDLGRWSPGGRYAAIRHRYDQIVDRLIGTRLAEPRLEERIDILSLILAPLRESSAEIDRRAVADELLTLLVAGHETTASSLAWTVERLRRHPEIVRRLEHEARGDTSPLRRATILEIHRVRPVIYATGRTVMKPFHLGEWYLPPGTRIVTQVPTLHEDARFHARPASFDPDRYVGRKPDTYAWIPFGGGVRRCIGASFAQMEMDVVLRTMLRHFELVPSGAPGEHQSFRGVAFAPSKGGLAVVRRRSTPLGGTGAAGADAARCPVDHSALAMAAANR